MIRNTVDHGVETVAERAKAGRPRTVVLSVVT
jgi:chemotaxis protein histidine kinase CheA